jgi:glycosyltransferase involved in cell wall biosynthesis
LKATQPLIFVSPAYGDNSLGGLAVSAERIVHHLASEHAVHVVTASALIPPLTHRHTDKQGISVVEVGPSADSALFLQYLADVIDSISSRLDNPRYLAFYCHSWAYATTIAARRRRTAPWLFARGNDIDLEIFGPAAFFTHYALQHAQAVFCVSREMQTSVHAFSQKPKTHYIPNGVSTEKFPWQTDYQPAAALRIGLFGDIKPKKGLDLLLETVDLNHFALHIVGQLREDNGKLLHGFLCLHPQAAIKHTPYVHSHEDLLAAYHSVDIVCIPSNHEGMSNVMLEAMAMGKVCVCAAVGGAKDVIRDGENGFLFEPRSTSGLKQALERARQCLQGDHETLRSQAAATIREHFSAAIERENYLQAMRW